MNKKFIIIAIVYTLLIVLVSIYVFAYMKKSREYKSSREADQVVLVNEIRT